MKRTQLKCDCCLVKSKYVKPVAGNILCDTCHYKLHEFSHLLLPEKRIKIMLEEKLTFKSE